MNPRVTVQGVAAHAVAGQDGDRGVHAGDAVFSVFRQRIVQVLTGRFAADEKATPAISVDDVVPH